MKYFLMISLSIAATAVAAQDVADSSLRSMIDAEYAFVRLAKEKNTRDAFLMFLTDHAVTFGKEPRIGKKHFETQVPNTSLLSWYPEYCDISASGDFGFNTGPWELRSDRTDPRPAAVGHFVTVWTREHGKPWRAALDIGISYPDPADSVPLKSSTIRPTEIARGEFHAVTEVEEKFIEAYSELGNKAYKEIMSEEVRFYRSGKRPFASPSAVEEFINTENIIIDFIVMGGAMSHSKELAYVYGTATVKTSKDGHITSGSANYVRIWKKEDGHHWKIVLDVLSQG